LRDAQELVDDIERDLADASNGLRFAGIYPGYEDVVPREQVLLTIRECDNKQHLCRGRTVSEEQAIISIFTKRFSLGATDEYTACVLTFDQADLREVGAALRVYNGDVPHSHDLSPLALLEAFLDVYGVALRITPAHGSAISKYLEISLPAWVKTEFDVVQALGEMINVVLSDSHEWIDLVLMKLSDLHKRIVRIEIAFAVDRRKYLASLHQYGIATLYEPTQEPLQ
jgi:hypothetical protein